MKSVKLWYLAALVVLATLSLAGCGGSTPGPVKLTEKGYKVTVGGSVEQSVGKAAALSSYSTVKASTVYVIDAQAGTVLGSGPITDGKFKDLTFTLPSAKAILVFKAVAGTTVRAVVPMDLSNPPAALGATNAISITIDANSDARAKVISQYLGLSGILGEGGQTLASKSKVYADALQLVVDNGGQALAYTSSGLSLSGKVNSALLPARQASTYSVMDLQGLIVDGKVTSAFIPGNNPIVNFQVTDKATGKGIAGLGTFALHVAQLNAEKDGDNSFWLSYIMDTAAGTMDRKGLPASDAGYSVVDNGDGSYVVTFGTNVKSPNPAVKSGINAVYDAALTHRIGIAITTVAVPGGYAGPVDPSNGKATPGIGLAGIPNLIYDFTPATGAAYKDATTGSAYARDIVKMGACNECHYNITLNSHHFGSRSDTKLCVMCHTPQLQRKFKDDGTAVTNPSAEFTPFIHKIHMGEELPTKQTIYRQDGTTVVLEFGEARYPQLIQNCTKCHKGADVDNWNTKATIKACGSCHNSIDFATGKGTTNDGRTVGHIGGAKSDNKTCTQCHDGASVKGYHQLNDVTPNNPTIPTGIANITYTINSASLNASKQPVINFTIKKDGAAMTLDATPSTRRVPFGAQGFAGGPTVGVYFGAPQDNVTAPQDFNASITASLVNLWNSSGGTVAKQTDGSYTATITSGTVPASAKVVTATIYGTMTQAVPFKAYSTGNETKLPTVPGVVRNVPAQLKAIGTARRAIVDNALCNKCHEQLGTQPNFHGGARNNGTMCAFCHTPNKTSSNAWSGGSSTFIHGIHGASKRTVPFNWHVDLNYPGVGYPGILRNCEQCHVSGGYDFSVTTDTSSLLYSTVATSRYTETNPATKGISPYVDNTGATFYGNGYSYSTSTGVAVQAGSSSLVNSPISAACSACHTTDLAWAHMRNNGGSLYEPRGTAFTNLSAVSGKRTWGAPTKVEQCLVCHGTTINPATSGNTFNSTVPTIKAVHRWW